MDCCLFHQVSPTKLINLNGVESVDIWQNHILRDITKKIVDVGYLITF